jgi:glycine hydroxymethyltransferase
MVPFDDKSPFVTSGIRIGTPAITTRGLNVSDMAFVANAIDRVISNASNEDVIRAVKMEVHEQMSARPLFV